MSSQVAQFDLLHPSSTMLENYKHQLKQTINAYSAAQIVIGEVLQNAMDAIVEAGRQNSKVQIKINFDDRSVTIRDFGNGFPNDPELLFLGGSRKRTGNKKIFGLVGVGLKVVLFCSEYFQIRSRSDSGSFKHEFINAYKFDQSPPPLLTAQNIFQTDPTPIAGNGTEISYRFPKGTRRDFIVEFVHELTERCCGSGVGTDFGKTLKLAVEKKIYDTRMSGMLSSYFRRFTYSGDILNRLGGKPELKGAQVVLEYECNDRNATTFGIANDLFDDKAKGTVSIEPTYLIAEDAATWVPNQSKPAVTHHELGAGGTNLTRTLRGFNSKVYSSPEDYEKLLRRSNQKLPDDIQEYKDKLFPRINGIILTIGRIPLFEEFLPGGSRRFLSANGVVTSHELDLTKGKNQQYVRCFDIVIDVDAALNYGKTQLTDNHLVSRVRRFLNDAYSATIQNAAGNWVGLVIPPDEVEEPDVFIARTDLGLPGFVLQKEPTDENDVIALFFELAGKGHFVGYRIYGLSQRDQYDSRATIKRVGDTQDPPTPRDDRQTLTVEFKTFASSVISDFERESKNAKDIHLLVAWKEGTTSSEQFAFADIHHSRFHPDKIFPGVTRYLVDPKTGSQVQVLLLSTIVEKLKQPVTANAPAQPVLRQSRR